MPSFRTSASATPPPATNANSKKPKNSPSAPPSANPSTTTAPWQVLHAGTSDELQVPGDPDVSRIASRIRPRANGAPSNTDTLRATRTMSTAGIHSTTRAAAWSRQEPTLQTLIPWAGASSRFEHDSDRSEYESANHFDDEAAYTASKD